MQSKFIAVAIVVLAGALIAGCGSSSTSTSTSSSAPAAATTTAAASSSAGSATTSVASSSAAAAAGSGGSSAAAAAAKQGCEAGIKSNPIIDASQRSALSAECQNVADAAATGDRTKFKAAYSSFCAKLAGALPAAAQATAKAACQQGANAIP